MLIASVLGVGIGVVSAIRSYSLFDNASMLFALIGISVPAFVRGIAGDA